MKEIKIISLLESFKKNVLMHHPSIKKSMTYINLHWIKNYDINTIFFIAIFFQWCKIFVWKWCDLAYLTRNTLTRCLYDLPPLAGILAQFSLFFGDEHNSTMSINIHCVAKVYSVLPFYDVKCLCSGGRKWGREESHSH